MSNRTVRIVYDAGPRYMGSAARVVLPDGSTLPGVVKIEIDPLQMGSLVTARVTLQCDLDITAELVALTKVPRGDA